MDELEEYSAKWNKPDTERQMNSFKHGI
jgi:hypothetical protein